jgi:hypothetical protein
MSSAVHRWTFAELAAPTPAAHGADVVRLPDGGLGNGVDTDVWAWIVEISGPMAVRLLAALGAAGVCAFASPVRPGSQDVWRLWVDVGHYVTAEQAVLAAMPDLVADARTDATAPPA